MNGPARADTVPDICASAWHGPVGQAALLAAPTTEADPVAVLVTLLALVGAIIGDRAYIRVGGVRHAAKLWLIVCGPTGAGRKGTSLAVARTILRSCGTDVAAYLDHRTVSGLASGEGLIAALGGDAKTTTPDAEPVAPDGRLTVIETEFARVLSASKRDGSTLGPVMRQLWDGGDAAIMTRAAPMSVHGTHTCLIAHITPHELRAKLADADIAGGTVNRFLLVASHRPHLLPDEPPMPDISQAAAIIRDVVADARRGPIREIRRDRAADALWRDIYRALNAREPEGMLGAVTARGPVQVMRLALTYALLDGRTAIGCEHLVAGLAVWHYVTASARQLFGDVGAETDVTRMAEHLEAAGEEGRTATQIHRHFRNSRSGDQLRATVNLLAARGQVVSAREEGKGRPVTRYWWSGGVQDPVLRLLRAWETDACIKDAPD